jgi:hypothetical protein
MADGRREIPAVVEFAWPVATGEGHRAAGVEDDRDPCVGLLLIELDVILVGLGEELPVE